jgi:opacity protein-like surface antigen
MRKLGWGGRSIFAAVFLVGSLAAAPCWAGDTELGGAFGFGFYHDATITNASGSAKAGFGPRFTLSGVLGHNLGEHLGIEGRYTFQDGDLELRGEGTEANLDGDAQSVLGELLLYANRKESRFRLFAAVGGGVKVYQGTQLITGPRPLSDFAMLDKASQARGLLTFGGGVKYSLTPHWLVRLDVRDYVTPFPTGVITPAPGATLHGRLNDLVSSLGFSRTF